MRRRVAPLFMYRYVSGQKDCMGGLKKAEDPLLTLP